MIVYIPTPITSAEQAESLPIGTVSMPDDPEDLPAIKITEQSWVCVWDIDEDHDATYDVASHGHMIGSTALVPIEAEEETTEQVQVFRGVVHVGPSAMAPFPARRLVTPWEPVTHHSLDGREAHE